MDRAFCCCRATSAPRFTGILTLKDTFRSLAVSKDAIVRQGDQTIIYTVADSVASAVTVRIRASLGTLVAIEGDGLEAGQQVVVRGNERIFPGSPVRTEGDQNPPLL